MLNQNKLLAALNTLNSPPEPFTLDNVILSQPTPYAGPEPWNTKITISAAPARGYSSHLDFYYHRIDLEELGNDFTIASARPFTIAGILLIVNNSNNAPEDERAELATIDLEEMTLPTFFQHGDVQPLTLTARADSMGWVGNNTIQLAYNLPDVSPLLDFFKSGTLDPFRV